MFYNFAINIFLSFLIILVFYFLVQLQYSLVLYRYNIVDVHSPHMKIIKLFLSSDLSISLDTFDLNILVPKPQNMLEPNSACIKFVVSDEVEPFRSNEKCLYAVRLRYKIKGPLRKTFLTIPGFQWKLCLTIQRWIVLFLYPRKSIEIIFLSKNEMGYKNLISRKCFTDFYKHNEIEF